MANIQPTPVLSPPPRIGGQESTILSMIPTLLHHGMVVVGLPYSFEGQSRYDEITGGSPYGASTITRADGSRTPPARAFRVGISHKSPLKPVVDAPFK